MVLVHPRDLGVGSLAVEKEEKEEEGLFGGLFD